MKALAALMISTVLTGCVAGSHPAIAPVAPERGLRLSGALTGLIPDSPAGRFQCEVYDNSHVLPGAAPAPVFASTRDVMLAGVGYRLRWNVQPYRGAAIYSAADIPMTVFVGVPQDLGIELFSPSAIEGPMWRSTNGSIRVAKESANEAFGTLDATLGVVPGRPSSLNIASIRIRGDWSCRLASAG